MDVSVLKILALLGSALLLLAIGLGLLICKREFDHGIIELPDSDRNGEPEFDEGGE